MTREEKELALYCLKASSDYHSEVCEECRNYPNCDHMTQDDVTETIIKALEQEPKTGHWIRQDNTKEPLYGWYFCSECNSVIGDKTKFCSNCGAKMVEPQESDHKCHTCKHYTSGEHDGSCGSYICKEYSNWESEDKE